MWIEIFKSGIHTDSKGNTKTWTDADLDTIVAGYNPAQHEAPVVIGHPKENAPAFGWVEAIKREGNVLLAKLKDLAPEFVEAVKKGMYKKRSMSLYPDLTLRHVGFLGAMPPAVKGLADVQFSAGEETTIEFSDEWKFPLIGKMLGSLRDFIIEKFGMETADKVMPSYYVDDLKQEPKPEATSPAFSQSTNNEEQDMNEIEKLKAKITELEGQLTQFSETDTAQKAELTNLRTQLAVQELKQRTEGFTSFCDALITEGKMTPAEKPAAIDLMEALHGIGEFEFAEGDKRVKKSALEVYKAGLSAMPKRVDFSETATRDRAGQDTAISAEFSAAGEVDPESLELRNKALALSKKENISFVEAVAQVRGQSDK